MKSSDDLVESELETGLNECLRPFGSPFRVGLNEGLRLLGCSPGGGTNEALRLKSVCEYCG